jgi:deaminated glutathione amidase
MSVRTSGTCHARSGPHKPHNSLYMIDDRGGIVDHYDKTFCAGDRAEDTDDLAHYSPGGHLGAFEIGRVRCGALICHDYRYPELYREYKRRGVQLVFHSYHAGNIPSETFKAMRKQVGAENRRFNTEGTIPGITTLATMIAEAANNHVWISCPNS